MNILLRRRPIIVKDDFLEEFNKEVDRICTKHKIEFVFYNGQLSVFTPYSKAGVMSANSLHDGWQELAGYLIESGNELKGHTQFSYMNGENKIGVHYRADEIVCQQWRHYATQIWER